MSTPPPMDDIADVRMPLTAHLEELRTRLVRALVAALAGMILAYQFIDQLFGLLIAPLTALRPDQALVIGTGVAEAFFTKLKVAFIAGIFAGSPVIFFQVWQFVAPGLYRHERRIAIPFALFASAFFVSGAAFCYRLVFPVAFDFFLQEYDSIGVAAQIRISEYLTFAARTLLGFGLTFELPVITFFLARVGMITYRTLTSGWRYALVGIFVVAAVLTPGPDIASQLLMAAPLIVLYVASIGVAYVFGSAPVPDEEPIED